jgi:hypothetical protein
MTRLPEVEQWGVYISGPDVEGWLLMRNLHEPLTSADRIWAENTATTMQRERPYHTVKAMQVQPGDVEKAMGVKPPPVSSKPTGGWESLEGFLIWLAARQGDLRFIERPDWITGEGTILCLALRIRNKTLMTHEVQADVLNRDPGRLHKTLRDMMERLERQEAQHP